MSAIVKQAHDRLRPMTEFDLDAVMEIEAQVYDFPWTRGIFRDCLHVGYCCWVYEVVGRIDGYGVMSIGAGEAHVLNLSVRPESQGKGLGRALLGHLLNVARKHRADTILLEVRPSNEPALGLYRAMGFNEVGTRRAYYPTAGGREDALILARSL